MQTNETLVSSADALLLSGAVIMHPSSTSC